MRKHEIAIFFILISLIKLLIVYNVSHEEIVFVVCLIDYLDDGSTDSSHRNLKIGEKQSFKLIIVPVLHMFVAKDSCTKFNFKWEIQE